MVGADQITVLFSVIVLHWMTSQDQEPTPPPTLRPEEPHYLPQIGSKISSRLPKSRATFDLERTIDMSGTDNNSNNNNNRLTTRDGHGLISVVISEENSGGHKGQSTDESEDTSDDSKGGITMRTSLTMESTRDDDSICENLR
jgi:hypothetical protein